MIKIISLIDWYKYYNETIKEFQKRLWKQVELIRIKPSKRKDINEIINEETKELIKNLTKEKWYKILLYIEWKQLNTIDFSNLIENKESNYSNIIFIVWWAYWVDLKMIEQYIDFKLSFSYMTFSHIQALMVLLEQIYRVFSIKKWIKYHH
jgi:23S rRNA (pseudouridine1915-N3)-methyltransferase